MNFFERSNLKPKIGGIFSQLNKPYLFDGNQSTISSFKYILVFSRIISSYSDDFGHDVLQSAVGRIKLKVCE